MSSASYGPEEAYLALEGHIYLAIFVAMGIILTIFVISTSYSQIVELFPTGGGGYLVASKLLSPYLGMLSGCALLIDYVLTIAISIASGVDAILSFLPISWQIFKLEFAFFCDYGNYPIEFERDKRISVILSTYIRIVCNYPRYSNNICFFCPPNKYANGGE